MTRVDSGGKERFHAGTDLLTELCEKIVAVADSKVTVARHFGKNRFGLGNFVRIYIDVPVPPARNCMVMLQYAHLNRVSVSSGANVKAGYVSDPLDARDMTSWTVYQRPCIWSFGYNLIFILTASSEPAT